MLKLSFCITCKNRVHQLSQTLKKNLDDNLALSNVIEFVLVNFHSNDGLHDYILNNFKQQIDSRYLKYFNVEMVDWHSSVAKNTAHYLASGEILVNLDCDNYTGYNGSGHLIGLYEKYGNQIIVHQSSGKPLDGSFGRISVTKKNFDAVGGYDESFNPMAYQDIDLIHRLQKHGLDYVSESNPIYNQAILNSKTEGIKYTSSKKSYMQMNMENMDISKKKILAGKILANNGVYGIRNI